MRRNVGPAPTVENMEDQGPPSSRAQVEQSRGNLLEDRGQASQNRGHLDMAIDEVAQAEQHSGSLLGYRARAELNR